MQCPYCNTEMKKGVLTGDGRSKVRWHENGEKIGMVDKLSGVGMIDAKYTLTTFEIESHYCESCHKMIFDTKISH